MKYSERPLKVLHLIPSDAIGGVEVAAQSLPAGPHGDITFAKHFMVPDPSHDDREPGSTFGPAASLNSPRTYLAAIAHIRRERPDLLIASLWRAVFVMLVCKALQPSMKTVVFLHNTGTAHGPDRLLNALGMALATQIWTDSHATRNARVGPAKRARSRVVSFLLDRRSACERDGLSPAFIFWGRLRTQKNLPRAIALFDKIRARHPDATLCVIGPNGGAKTQVAEEIRSRGLEDAVTIEGPKSTVEIAAAAARAHFYFQTSDHEGMAMSVVEAMQYGLVPVVTPVGEIAAYTRDGETAIHIRDDARTLDAIDDLLANPDTARAMSASAAAAWEDAPLYRDDVLRFARDLVAPPPQETPHDRKQDPEPR